MVLRRVAVCFVLALMVIVSQGVAQESENGKEFARRAKRIAGEYSILSGDRPLELRGDSVLTWTNPEVGEIYGGVYVWTDRGQPKVIASIYKWYSPYTHSTHEFQSLSTKPIRATRAQQSDWSTSEPGVRWKVLPAAPSPGRSAPQRLAQMRGLAKRFQFSMIEKDESISNLRLLSQPLLRYSSHENSVLDGGLFAFAKATDPEAVLLLEARDENGKARWHYAIARSNFLSISARYQGEEVWSAKRLERSQSYSGSGAYCKYEFPE